jgi:gliding motility-associated-like protein
MGIGTTLDAGTGKIALYGLAGGSGIANAQAISTSAAGSGWTIRSASTEADAITLIGDATSTNSSATSLGINFAGIIEATGNGGGIALTGTSGTSTSFGDGLGIVGDVLAASGTITITGTDDATNVNNRDVFIVGATLGSKTATNVTSSTANVVVRGNRPAFGSNVAVNTSGTFTLEPAGDDFTNAITYPIADLSLDAAVSGLTIGKASSADGTSDANVTIASAVDVAGPITVYGGDLSINSALTATAADINLHASGTVSQSAALTANGLGLHGGGTFTLQNSSNNVATIAGGTSGIRLGNIVYRDVNTLEIGSVNPDGIFSSGTVLIETENGNLTLSENINTTSTSDEAIILNAGRASSARTSSGGDIIISGSPTLTYGTGGRAKLFSGAEENSNLNTFVGGNENTRRGFDEVSQPNNLEDDTTYAIYRYGNLAPSVTSTSVTSATAESLYLYDIKSSDPENDFISWSVTTIPDWLTFSSDAVQTNFLGTGVRPTNTGDGTNQASDGTTASSAVISTGTAAHGDNKLFFTDKEEYGIRYVDSNGQVQTWYQGDGNWQSLNPVGIVYDVTNDAVYVGDYSRSDILKIDNNGSKTLLSDLPEPFMFRLLLNSSNSKLYVSARGGIYEIDLTNNNPSTNYKRVVGTGRFGYSDTGLASTSQVFFPHGMDFDSSGRLVFTDRYNDIIRRVNLSEDTIETIAGKQGQGVESGDGGLAINATFADPSGLVINENDEIFISERLSKRIRKINVNGTIDTFFRVSSGGFADDLVISATGELYLLTSNLVAQVATVAKLTGTPTNADAGTHDVKLILSDGVNYTPYNFQITVDSKLIGATVVVTDNLTSEDGDTGSFTLVLDSKPTADVTISLSSSDTGEGSIAVSSVTFTPSNWNTPQIITVTGVDDVLSDGPKDYQIVTGNVTSSDINYNALDGTTINDAGFSNEDNDPDADGDGREDNADAFPTDPSEDTDTDGDGTGDNKDIFPNDPDRNGDTDGDGVSDPFDLCPGTVAGESVDANGCAASQRDTDDDGINDNLDNCVTTTNPDQSDVDGDGVGDVCDNAPNTPNEDQRDTDGDGIPDAVDEDDDNDGVPDAQDDFPTDPNETTDTDRDGQGDNADTDLDNDGVLNGADNCPSASNTNQLDTDGDGIGDVCDSDDDGDGHSDSDEVECGSNPLLASSKPLDTDNDGIANCIDTDDDNDGYLDTDETTCGSDPLDATSKPLDTDSDGIANCIDTDDDNDSYLDENDAFPLDATEWLDTDEDGIGNNADTDDDGDGQLDTDEITCGSDPLLASSMSLDTDGDSVPDCEDTDDDNDGVVDTEDAFPLDTTEWTDTDGDGIGNNADTDDDNDGFTDLDELICDSDPLDRFNKPADQDNDLIPDCIDTDRDGDGYLNSEDVFPDDSDEWVDTDGDGLGDNFEVDDDNDGYLDTNDAFPLDPNEWADADGDGVGDNLDTDDNNDGFNDSDLLVSGVLTPNSSGLESTWKIINIDKYPNARVSVYNKNGQEVFSAQGYRNDWRGTYKDSTDPLPASSYYYVIELNTGEGPITGWVYISY